MDKTGSVFEKNVALPKTDEKINYKVCLALHAKRRPVCGVSVCRMTYSERIVSMLGS